MDKYNVAAGAVQEKRFGATDEAEKLEKQLVACGEAFSELESACAVLVQSTPEVTTTNRLSGSEPARAQRAPHVEHLSNINMRAADLHMRIRSLASRIEL